MQHSISTGLYKMHSQKELEVELSRLHEFESPDFLLEQYATPSHIAAEWIWSMAMKSEVNRRVIADLASGPGILGLGLLLMGAKKVYFVDKDSKIMQVCQQNYEQLKEKYDLGKAVFVVGDVSLFDPATDKDGSEIDIVVQNPPFGTKNEHIDRLFLEKAFDMAPIVYSMHKYSTKKFVEAISKDHGFTMTEMWRFDFPVKAKFAFHKKPVKYIDVGLWRMEKD